MLTAIRAEFRKIFTVRSTYGIILFTLAIAAGLVAFWIFGYKDSGTATKLPTALQSMLEVTVNFITFILSFIAILAVGHEYRYNTILYALTANNHRSKVFFAKLKATLIVVLAATAVITLVCVAAFNLGQNLAGIQSLSQRMPGAEYLWRVAVAAAGTAAIGYFIAMLVRSQILAITAFLVIPFFIESLLTLLLKDNVKYLPFTALANVLSNNPTVSHAMSAAVVGAWSAGLGLLAWVLFVRRDSN